MFLYSAERIVQASNLAYKLVVTLRLAIANPATSGIPSGVTISAFANT
jgi:hypothetical protein